MIKVSETRSALRRMVLTKIAFSAPALGGAMAGGGAVALGAGIAGGVGSAVSGGLATPAVASGAAAGLPLLAGGAGVLAGDLLRRGADAVTGGGFTRRVQEFGDRVGGAVGSAYQRLSDAMSAAKRDDALNTEALNAYNRNWQKFAPSHSFENFQRFKQKYLQDRRRSAATRIPVGK